MATEKQPASKSNGSAVESLSRAELNETLARMDELQPKWKTYHDDRKAKKEKRRNVAAFREYEALYARVRRAGMTVRKARATIAK